jgi:anthranilate phosphoribosyltransferase
MSPLTPALERLAEGGDLSADQAYAAVSAIMDGGVSEAVLAAFLTALRVKGESADELAGAVQAVRDRMVAWEPLNPHRPVLDTCGTGGDGARTVNISTATAIVVAACGVPVAKHGNRSASGNSGSAEVLAELGVSIEVPQERLRGSLAELGITFLFAPMFHPALRFAGPVRRQLPFRTFFNLVGPLANPARPEYHLLGTPNERQARLLAASLARLGVRRAAVVCGADGLDEVTLAGPTRVWLIESGDRNGEAVIAEHTWQVEEFGLERVDAAELRVAGPAESAERIRRVLADEHGPDRRVVLANSAAALWLARAADSLASGVECAARAIGDGSAARLLERWGRVSRAGD